MQACLTKFFQVLDPSKAEQYHDYLFQKEEADRIRREEERLARIKAECDRLREIKKQKLYLKCLALRKRDEERDRLREEFARRKLQGQLVLPGIYIGNRFAARNWQWIIEMNNQVKLSHILNVTPSLSNYFEEGDHREDVNDMAKDLEILNESFVDFDVEDVEDVEVEEVDVEVEEMLNGEKTVEEWYLVLESIEEDELKLKVLEKIEKFGNLESEKERCGEMGKVENEKERCGEMENEREQCEQMNLIEIEKEQSGEIENEKEQYEQMDLIEKEKEQSGEIDQNNQNNQNNSINQSQLNPFPSPHLQPNLTYLRIPINDDRDVNLSPHFPIAFDFIRHALSTNSSVLVHCREGRSRSVAIIIAYLLIEKKWYLNQAIERIDQVVPDHRLNDGFKQQLVDLEWHIYAIHSYPDWLVYSNTESIGHVGENNPRRSNRLRSLRGGNGRMGVGRVEVDPVGVGQVGVDPVGVDPVGVDPVGFDSVRFDSVRLNPVQTIKVDQTSIEQTPMEQTPMEQTPIEHTPIEHTPIEHTQLKVNPNPNLPSERKKKTHHLATKKDSSSKSILNYFSKQP